MRRLIYDMYYAEEISIDIAIKLLETEWTGKLVTSSLMRMADQIEALLVLRGLSSKDKWEMGRVLSSALCYAGVY